MHVFTPGASVVRFTEEETRSTFEPPPSRARKKNAVATASLFPPRERKKNTRRRPKEFKKSSKMGSSSFERARKMTSKKAYRIIDVLVRVRHGRSLRLWRLLWFLRHCIQVGVFLRGVLNVSLKSGGFVKESNFLFLESVFGEQKLFSFPRRSRKSSNFFTLGWWDLFPSWVSFNRLLNPNDFFFRKYLISPI